MRIDYYIDESGNSGDLANRDATQGFRDQPFFSLAAIGIADAGLLEAEITRLKLKHRVLLTELKSSRLWAKPEFVLDLVGLICKEGWPFLIEIVDKKYLLCIHIVTCQLLPPFEGGPEGALVNYVRNELADYLYDNAPDEVFATVVAACKMPSDATLRAEFAALLRFSSPLASEEDRAKAIHESATRALHEYEAALGDRNDAYFDFLPLPDSSKHGKPIWMLPNLSSLMNIYARINRCEEGKISEVRLVHDEQAHFDEILQTNKATAESLRERAVKVFTPHSNFDFIESARLIFAPSSNSRGLQIADVVAGFCMRYAKSFFEEPNGLSRTIHEIFGMLTRHTDPDRGIGINQVMSLDRAEILTRTGIGILDN